jgi:hypothetical protein
MNSNTKLFYRFYIYQKERFPFIAYFFIIGAFSFSSIAYSRLCGGFNEFISLEKFLVCIFNTITIFFIMRILDEFKDQEEDKKYRAYLPVPRGLISLNELKIIGIIAVILQLIVLLTTFPKMLFLLLIVYGYLFFMTKEFFVKNWLKKNPFWYVTSHMLIIPLVDLFASGFDWFLEDNKAPFGLIYFFIVSFFNGLVLEIGRKIKAPENEEPGVLSYSFQLGTNKATHLWIFLLLITSIFVTLALFHIHKSIDSYIILQIILFLSFIPAFLFLKTKNIKNSKLLEYFSAFWNFSVYLILGGLLMFKNLFNL